MNYRSLKNLTLSLLATTAVVTGAQAQEAPDDQVMSVYERYRPDYSASGIRSGGFLFYPTMAVQGKFDSNIFAQDDAVADEVDDFITIIKPGMMLQSNWNNNSLGLFADATVGRYADNGAEDYEDFNIGANGQIDISRGTNFFAALTYSEMHEDRGSLDDAGGVEPTPYSTFLASAGFKRDEGLVSFAVEGSYDKKDYDPVELANGDISGANRRDREQYTGSVRLGYHLNDDYEAFVKLTTTSVDYRLDPRDSAFTGPVKNSDGWKVVGGTAFKLSGKTEGEVYLGYVSRDFDAGEHNDVDEVTFGASVLWSATDLTSVKVGVNRDVIESALAAGILNTSYSATVEHELRRNFLMKAGVSFSNMEFLDLGGANAGRDDDMTNITAGAKYMLNRTFSLNADYSYDKRSAGVADQDYKRHAFIVSLAAQW